MTLDAPTQQPVRQALAGAPPRSDDGGGTGSGTSPAPRAPVRPTCGAKAAAGDSATQDSTAARLAAREAEIRQAQKMEAIGRLAGGIAHDFNNLLTAVLGASDMLLEVMSPLDSRREDVLAIREAGQRAAGLTRQLLAFSRQQPIDPRTLDLSALVKDASRVLGRLVKANVRIDMDLSSTPVMVTVDPSQIEQVLINLVVNAADSMPDGGRLSIRTRVADTGEGAIDVDPDAPVGRIARLEVDDTGTGMTEDVLLHIFEPFFTTKPAGKGTGIGLAAVYGIVKQSGGRVHVVSTPGQGSLFTVDLPLADVEATVDETPAAVHGTAHGARTVLVVDDEPALATMVARVLERRGYDVLRTASCADAVRIALDRAGEIDLLLSDVVLPDGNGIDLVERLRPRCRDLHVMLMSGHSDAHTQALLAEHPEMPFLTKPFDSSTLLHRVATALEH